MLLRGTRSQCSEENYKRRHLWLLTNADIDIGMTLRIDLPADAPREDVQELVTDAETAIEVAELIGFGNLLVEQAEQALTEQSSPPNSDQPKTASCELEEGSDNERPTKQHSSEENQNSGGTPTGYIWSDLEKTSVEEDLEDDPFELSKITRPWASNVRMSDITERDLAASRTVSISIRLKPEEVRALINHLTQISACDWKAICDRAYRTGVARLLDDCTGINRGDFGISYTIPPEDWVPNEKLPDQIIIHPDEIDFKVEKETDSFCTPPVVDEVAEQLIDISTVETKSAIIRDGVRRLAWKEFG